MFTEGHLTLGIGFPIEAYSTAVPTMQNQVAMAQLAEESGFAALWCRDVPLYDPGFGDVGQMYDPWVWLGYMAAHTSNVALATGSIILPLRQRVDIAKSASSVDQLSQGRLVLGVASGDRPVEYSVYDATYENRDEVFRSSVEFIRATTHRPSNWKNEHVEYARQIDILPKSYSNDIPMLVTGNSRQSVEWIAGNSDGWLMYPRPLSQQKQVLKQWTDALDSAEQDWKPFAQSLYIDLSDKPDAAAQPIHLGYRVGRQGLIEHLGALRGIGVNHVLLNVKFSSRPVVDVLHELQEFVIPEFPALR